MKTIKTLLVLAVMLVISSSSYAHALWIEANSNGQKGKSQEVKIFYGEFATGEIEPVNKWYSDVKEFTLWLTGPDQKREKVNVTAKDDHFVAQFTPETDGVYYLTVLHDAKEIAGKTKYEFSSVAAVRVGKSVVSGHDHIENSLKVIAPQTQAKVSSPTKIQVFMDGTPQAKGKVIVTSENGWAKEFTANEAGEITFSPIWKGKYVLEATNFKKGEGELQGNVYESTWQGATAVMYVQ